jgi:hypothetical protein
MDTFERIMRDGLSDFELFMLLRLSERLGKNDERPKARVLTLDEVDAVAAATRCPWRH